MALRIPASQEETVRWAEKNINTLWERWSAKDEFKDKTSAEILGMVTFRFAELYYNSENTAKKLSSLVEELDSKFSQSLFEIEESQEDDK